MNNIKWAAFQPLIGGMALAAENAFGNKPQAIISYDGVGNDDLYYNYEKDVKGTNIPRFVIDGTLYSLAENLKDDKKWDDPLLQNLDVVVAVPICAGLSSANTQTNKNSKMGRGSDAFQNNNMIGILSNTLKYIKPKVFIFENAVKLATPLGDGIREKLIKMANDSGYGTTIVKVNTINHGLPQHRTRTFFYAFKDSNGVNLTYEHTDPPTISEVIKGCAKSELYNPGMTANNSWFAYLKDIFGNDWKNIWGKEYPGAADAILSDRNDFDYAKKFFNEKGQKHLDYWKYKKSIGKGWMGDAPIYQGNNRVNALYGRTMSRQVHPTEDRGFTVREIMRLMGLPDDMPEPTKMLGMIGQNVPVCTATYYINQINKYFNGELKLSDNKNVMQDFITKSVQPKDKKKLQTGFTNFIN